MVGYSHIVIHRVGGKANPADLMTKHLSGDGKCNHLYRMRLVVGVGRPANAPNLQGAGIHSSYRCGEPYH